MRKRKIKSPDGKMVDATEMSFQNVREHWNEYLLDDGTVLRVKPVATQVFRVDDMYDAEGNPMYMLASHNVLVVNAPDHLKRPGGDT